MKAGAHRRGVNQKSANI